jgi:hypothetical protein
MTTSLTLTCPVPFQRRNRHPRIGGSRNLEPTPSPMPPGRVPRVARLMALAIRFEQLLREGVVADYAALARLGHVSRARVTQIMNLLCLAPDLQEALLFLPRTERGRDPIILRDLQPIATALAWREQRWLWAQQQQPDTVAASTTNPGRRNPRKKDKSRPEGA